MQPAPSAAVRNDAPRRGDRVLPLVLLVAAAGVGALLAALRPPQAAPPGNPREAAMATVWTPSPMPTGQTVSLTIDFGNGARREFDALPWRAGMTVGDLMHAAASFGPPVTWAASGVGEMAMLTSLEGVANQGPGGAAWLYSVDGRHGEVSYAVQPLDAGAAVLWEFHRGE